MRRVPGAAASGFEGPAIGDGRESGGAPWFPAASAHGFRWFSALVLVCLWAPGPPPVRGQVETGGPAEAPLWTHHGRTDGHLALKYSPDAAFSPDGSTLAIVNQDKIALIDLSSFSVRKVLHPHLQDVIDLAVESANFISPTRLFILASGLVQVKGKEKGVLPRTPLLGFEWYIDGDSLFGTVKAVGAGGGFGPILYFPQIGYVGLYKEGHFDLWSPESNRGGRVAVPGLTHRPNLFAFSPDGHWLLLAQIEANATGNPAVVDLRQHQFVDVLAGHQGTVLSIAFSPDARRVATACEDGKVRLFSAGDWKLLATLSGHQGPVHWAEFSHDGKWLASGGEDTTVRIWSAMDGNLMQTLEEGREPIVTVAFSPTGHYLAASSERSVFVWSAGNH